jgi:hypothetical protein
MTDQDSNARAEQERQVLDVWNKQAEIGGYRPHRSLLPVAEQAIRKIIKQGYSYDDIKGAIKNYAHTISPLTPQFFWKYRLWRLDQFLSRGVKDDRGSRWLEFHPDTYCEEKWWTKPVREQATLNRERLLAKEKKENSKPITGLPRLSFNSVPNFTEEDRKKQESRRLEMRKQLFK